MLNDPLWQALASMRIEPEGASLTFTKRLARENGWSHRYAAQVMDEYRRFLYLAATGTQIVTPSEQVDQAWHLHLTYTRHYWGELCARIIGKPLHHGPTAGGSVEGRKYRNLYTETLARYRATFGAEPPAEIWPPTELRFAGHYQWVDRSRNYVLPRRSVSIGGLAGGAVLLAACASLTTDEKGPVATSEMGRFLSFMSNSTIGFFSVVVFVFVATVVIVNTTNRLRRKVHLRQRGHSRNRNARQRQEDVSGSSDIASDGWLSGTGTGIAAGGAVFMAGGGDFGGSGADGGWESGSSDSSSTSSDSGSSDSGCGGGCGGGD